MFLDSPFRSVARCSVGGLLLVALPVAATAATVEGAFTFTKLTPSVALVYLPEDTGALPQEVAISHKDKAFTPRLAVGAPGSAVLFRNEDTVQYNIFAEDKDLKVSFDAGISESGSSVEQKITWAEGTILRCGCKVHPAMEVYIAALRSRFVATVEFTSGQKTASFSIPNVPAGASLVRVWTPRQPATDLKATPSAALDFIHKGATYGSVAVTIKP